MRAITSRHNPVVARFRAAARGERHGEILLDGAHLVAEGIEAGVEIREAAVLGTAADRAEIRRLVDRLERAGVRAVTMAASVMAAVSPVRSSSAIVALAGRPAPAGDKIYRGSRPLVIIAHDVQDPGNVGAIVRVAEAAGATGVAVSGASADPFGWKALRGSMGSALRMAISVEKGQDTFAEARRRGCRVVATSPRGGRSLFDVDLTGPIALAIGGEGAGLPAPLMESADDRVTLPMQAPVESLNAAVTAALIVFEARRQRGKKSDG